MIYTCNDQQNISLPNIGVSLASASLAISAVRQTHLCTDSDTSVLSRTARKHQIQTGTSLAG